MTLRRCCSTCQGSGSCRKRRPRSLCVKSWSRRPTISMPAHGAGSSSGVGRRAYVERESRIGPAPDRPDGHVLGSQTIFEGTFRWGTVAACWWCGASAATADVKGTAAAGNH